MTSPETCSSCRLKKATLSCGVCEGTLCKGCAQYLDEQTFSFFKEIPPELSHTYYCPSCHEETVVPALESYESLMEQARNAYFFFITQKRSLPVQERAKEKVKVEDCQDRNETILRLAFQAVQLGFNSIIEAEVTSEKVRNAGYQKSKWRGVGVPATIDREKLERRRGE